MWSDCLGRGCWGSSVRDAEGHMTDNSNFKRLVRARAAKTGESYTAALQHFRRREIEDPVAGAHSLRLAVAQCAVREDPRSVAELRQSAAEVRRLMREAHEAGARLVHLPEGATCFPHKRALSIGGPERVGPADWDQLQWPTPHEELAATSKLAGDLGIWTVLGSVHRLSPPHRPHNSLYVIAGDGSVATRYDERYLSRTKLAYMYSPGSAPITFEVDGFRFGCALGIESHFAEVFSEYERLDVDCVLFSTTAGAPDDPNFATEAQGHAASNSYYVSFSVPAQYSTIAPSGIIDGRGEWLARCPSDGTPATAVVDLQSDPENPARSWRRTARAAVHDTDHVRDPRSEDRGRFYEPSPPEPRPGGPMR
jgi:predicted amidohydrolase